MNFWGNEAVNGRGLPLREHAAAVAREASVCESTCTESCPPYRRKVIIADELRNAISAAWLAVDRLPPGPERDAIGRGLERVKAFSAALVKP